MRTEIVFVFLCTQLILIPLSAIARTPAPAHSSCTDDVISDLTCPLDESSCNYITSPSKAKSSKLYWRIYARPLRKNNKANYLQLQGNLAQRRSMTKLAARITDQSVQAVCMEFKYRVIGTHSIRVVNDADDGSRHTIGYVSRGGDKYPAWRTSRFQSCVYPNSSISFTVMKISKYLTFDLDSISVTKSTMDCSNFGKKVTEAPTTGPTNVSTTNSTKTPATPTSNSTDSNSNSTTPVPQANTTATASNATTSAPSRNSTASNATTSAPSRNSTGSTQKPDKLPHARNYTCSPADTIRKLSCNFETGLCGYTSKTRGSNTLAWKRDFFQGANGISASAFDPNIDVPIGTSTRLRGALLDHNISAACVRFSYWAHEEAAISVFNERPDGLEVLVGNFTGYGLNQRTVAQINSCVSKNSFISFEVSKTSKHSLYVWLDDVVVMKSAADCA